MQINTTPPRPTRAARGKGRERRGKRWVLGGRGSLIDNFEIEIIGFDALGCLLLLDVVQPAELLELSEGQRGVKERKALVLGGREG